jgi:hypothetical protein
MTGKREGSVDSKATIYNALVQMQRKTPLLACKGSSPSKSESTIFEE